MTTPRLLALTALLTLTACGQLGEIGDACTTDEDCAEGLECHVHHDHDSGEAHEDEEEETGACEAHEDE